MSILVMECLLASSWTAEAASVSIVASSLTIMILLSVPTGREWRDLLAAVTSRTAAIMVVFGRRMRAERMPLPIPRPAPVITYVRADIVQKSVE